ncbi:MAG: endonuclease/exonuclease/phosphatase family protein [Bacteriovoracaceae bacterium]
MSTLNSWGIPFFSEKLEERFAKIGKESAAADIMGLQEVFQGSKHIVKNLRKNQKHIYLPASFPWLHSGLMFITKHQVVQKKHFSFPECGGIQCLVDRGVLFLQIKLPTGQLINIFNLHLQAYEEYKDVRALQLKSVALTINEILRDGNPSIVMGDLNVMDSSLEFKDLQNKLPGFKDVWKIKGKGPGHTWNPEANPWSGHEGESKVFQRLDYILIKDGLNSFWEVEAAQLEFNRPGLFLSDHFGVGANLRLIKKPETVKRSIGQKD